ncbi:MAG: Carboxymuconolactone decarboxylase [Ilumatobacteraceae bacterium]|nr:Carboxymuconolactone decarboxylase [Ilumatobacteraceae bacterium]
MSAEPPRLAPLPAEEWGEAEYAAYGALLGVPGERVPRAGSGHAFDPVRFDVVTTMVRHPALAKAFWAFSSYQMRAGSLPVRLRELAILRTAHRRQSAYEWGQHVKIALDSGITEAEIDQLVRGNFGFAAADLLVLEAADELISDGHIGDATWLALQGELDTAQVMDLVFVVGTYTTLAMAFETWRLQPEPGSAPLPARS